MVDSINNLAKSDDFVIIISLLGESEEVIKLAEKLRLSGIATLSITRMKNNTLASLCDENLYINSIQIQVDYIGYEISTPYFILIELLFLKYQEYLNNL
jgi:RpiR family glv operon transcriptional regulator